ncbi:MAG TPA: hypothetical protein VFX59_12490 [Polyangiales bacterium]|nr:hypothetical protein [Polyangiales bacterium]
MRTWWALALALVACDSTDDPIALDQPIVVQQGDFKQGALPSSEANTALRITSFALGFGTLRPGTRNAQVTGRASETAYSVGVRFADQGTGYWVRPVGGVDPLIPGELQWQLSLDASVEIEAGLHQLEVVAFDKDGKPGVKQALAVCVAADIPDNGNACSPKTLPPYLIAHLSWDTDADLDLSLVAPDGTRFDRSKRSLLVNGKVLARLDNDGVVACLADGRRSENFIWNDVPPTLGRWNIFANLFDACGKPAASFTLTIYTRTDNGDGTFALTPIRSVGGDLLRQQANGGAGNPLFVTSVDFAAP